MERKKNGNLKKKWIQVNGYYIEYCHWSQESRSEGTSSRCDLTVHHNWAIDFD